VQHAQFNVSQLRADKLTVRARLIVLTSQQTGEMPPVEISKVF